MLACRRGRRAVRSPSSLLSTLPTAESPGGYNEGAGGYANGQVWGLEAQEKAHSQGETNVDGLREWGQRYQQMPPVVSLIPLCCASPTTPPRSTSFLTLPTGRWPRRARRRRAHPALHQSKWSSCRLNWSQHPCPPDESHT